MRALQPDRTGFAERDGVRTYWELFGDQHAETILFLPAWSIVNSRMWKAQVPYFARRWRVLTFDGRGSGLSDRPADAAAYTHRAYADDALAVLDATGTPRAALVSLSAGARWALVLAAEHPERVTMAAFIAASIPTAPQHAHRMQHHFEQPLDTDEDWAKFNQHYWRREYQDFLAFFFDQALPEPHSTKQHEDCVGWGQELSPETLIATQLAPPIESEETLELAARVRCPVLVLHGDQDTITPYARGATLARATGGDLVTLEGSGHLPQARDPVKVNRLLTNWLISAAPHAPRRTCAAEEEAEPDGSRSASTWTRGRHRRRRALYISSPIGLGHAQRDVSIADELRKLHPDLDIDWLAQHPVTEVLERRGERVHPASALLSSEAEHIDSESAEHDLHCFQAWRRMDEILVANFMTFHDLVREEPYDLWIGDEAWEIDYYLHENPELKTATYAWLTDFVGWLPMPDGGEHEAYLAADYNAEMIAHIARYPRIRDRAVFVGNPDDIVPQRFGPNLPGIREWTTEHYDFAGYVTGFDPAAVADRAAVRRRLGYADDEQVCIVTVGGSGVGGHLLQRVIAAYPEARRQIPNLRMVVVAGPRIDRAALPSVAGVEVHAYVHELYRHLAVCDLAVVQGGLTTTMELVANRRPFLYFPLRHHFEQNFHVRHRLDRDRAGRCMDFATATPDVIAGAMAQEINRITTAYRPVESDGAQRAAALIATLL